MKLRLIKLRSMYDRFRSEVTSPRDVCKWAGFSKDICGSIGTNVIEPVEIPDNNPTELSPLEESVEERVGGGRIWIVVVGGDPQITIYR